jgi:hypothetical protein
MKVTGRCHCGQIAYEAEADPKAVQMCHCLDCQTLTGSAFRVMLAVPPENFRLVKGTPKIYMKVADSGSRRGHAFCGDCGAPVYRLPTDNTPTYSLRIGGLDQRMELGPPQRQIWVKRRLPWVTTIGGVAEVHGQK